MIREMAMFCAMGLLVDVLAFGAAWAGESPRVRGWMREVRIVGMELGRCGLCLAAAAAAKVFLPPV